MAQAMNLLMPGNAFLYYGEEIGMRGTANDETKRLAMRWSGDSKAKGMCVGPQNASGKRPAYSEAPAIAHGQLTELKRLTTSAAIANVYWNYRMFLATGDSKYQTSM